MDFVKGNLEMRKPYLSISAARMAALAAFLRDEEKLTVFEAAMLCNRMAEYLESKGVHYGLPRGKLRLVDMEGTKKKAHEAALESIRRALRGFPTDEVNF